MKKGLIKATDAYERTIHWMLAVSCLLLCVSGLGMMYHSLNFLGTMIGGLKVLKLIHNFLVSGMRCIENHLAGCFTNVAECGQSEIYHL